MLLFCLSLQTFLLSATSDVNVVAEIKSIHQLQIALAVIPVFAASAGAAHLVCRKQIFGARRISEVQTTKTPLLGEHQGTDISGSVPVGSSAGE